MGLLIRVLGWDAAFAGRVHESRVMDADIPISG